MGLKASTYQKPKDNHPWRQYADRVQRIEEVEIEIEIESIVSVKQYLKDVVDNWERIEVTTSLPQLGHRQFTLNQLPQKKAAAYIIGVLKRNYVQKNNDI